MIIFLFLKEMDFQIDQPNKIYIIGDRKVGKSNIIRFLQGKSFSQKIQSIMGISFSYLTLNNIKFTIKEMTDNDQFKFINYYKDEIEDILLLIVVFSIDNEKSFEYAKWLIQFTFDNMTNNQMPILLCGNKCDLKKENVDENLIFELVNNIKDCKYVQISCKEGINMKHILKFIKKIEINDDMKEKNINQNLEGISVGSCNIF